MERLAKGEDVPIPKFPFCSNESICAPDDEATTNGLIPAEPTTLRVARGLLVFIPTILLNELTVKVPLSTVRLPAIVLVPVLKTAKVPVAVTFPPRKVLPETSRRFERVVVPIPKSPR